GRKIQGPDPSYRGGIVPLDTQVEGSRLVFPTRSALFGCDIRQSRRHPDASQISTWRRRRHARLLRNWPPRRSIVPTTIWAQPRGGRDARSSKPGWREATAGQARHNRWTQKRDRWRAYQLFDEARMSTSGAMLGGFACLST